MYTAEEECTYLYVYKEISGGGVQSNGLLTSSCFPTFPMFPICSVEIFTLKSVVKNKKKYTEKVLKNKRKKHNNNSYIGNSSHLLKWDDLTTAAGVCWW